MSKYTSGRTTQKRDKCIQRKQSEISALQAENAALRAKVAELEKRREWLPIDENTPKNTHLLLLAGSTPLIHVGLYDSYLGYWNWCYGEDPTHYMPLPQGLAK